MPINSLAQDIIILIIFPLSEGTHPYYLDNPLYQNQSSSDPFANVDDLLNEIDASNALIESLIDDLVSD